jgi:hypothetical protein
MSTPQNIFSSRLASETFRNRLNTNKSKTAPEMERFCFCFTERVFSYSVLLKRSLRMRSPSPRPPGWRMPTELRQEVERSRRNQARMSDPQTEDARRSREENKKSVRHLGKTFRDTHEVLRESGGIDSKGKSKAGRFAKETTPKHKRPERIPWKKKTDS